MSSKPKRTRRLRKYPQFSIEECLNVAQVICTENGSRPISRLSLAQKLGTTPLSSAFTIKLNSSEMYGFTVGKYNSDTISVTNRGEIVVQNNDLVGRKMAICHAAIQPKIFQNFYNLYNGKNVPGKSNAIEVLRNESDIFMDDELGKECFDIVIKNGLFSEIILEVGKKMYVNLSGLKEQPLDVINISANKPVDQDEIYNIPNNTSNIVSIDQAVARKTIFLGYVGLPEITHTVVNILDSMNITYKSSNSSGQVTSVLTPFFDQDMRDSGVCILIFANSVIDIVAEGKKVSPITPMLVQLGAALTLHGTENVLVIKEKDIHIGIPGLREIEFSNDDLEHLTLLITEELIDLGILQVNN